MKASSKTISRRTRDRSASGRSFITAIHLPSQLRDEVDAWAAKQVNQPRRPEAIRRRVELGLERGRQKGAGQAATRRKEAAKASEMAGQEIDRLADPLATDEERQYRKRRLIEGPKEFRDMRSNRPKAKR